MVNLTEFLLDSSKELKLVLKMVMLTEFVLAYYLVLLMGKHLDLLMVSTLDLMKEFDLVVS